MVGRLLSLSTYVYHSTLQSSLDNNYIQIPLCNFHVRSPAEANKFRNKLLPNQLHRHRNLAIDTRHAYMHFLKTMKGIGFKSSTVHCMIFFTNQKCYKWVRSMDFGKSSHYLLIVSIQIGK